MNTYLFGTQKQGADNPFYQGFHDQMLEGPLNDRLNLLMQKYPKNIRLVKDVITEVTGDGKTVTGNRDILVKSLAQLTQTKALEIQNDVINHLARDTVSFPLSQNASHLYTRFGDKTMDFMGQAPRLQQYPLVGNERLEPFIHLTRSEEQRLGLYISNSLKNPNVLGPFNYEGNQKTNKRLDDNRCLAGAHN